MGLDPSSRTSFVALPLNRPLGRSILRPRRPANRPAFVPKSADFAPAAVLLVVLDYVTSVLLEHFWSSSNSTNVFLSPLRSSTRTSRFQLLRRFDVARRSSLLTASCFQPLRSVASELFQLARSSCWSATATRFARALPFAQRSIESCVRRRSSTRACASRVRECCALLHILAPASGLRGFTS